MMNLEIVLGIVLIISYALLLNCNNYVGNETIYTIDFNVSLIHIEVTKNEALYFNCTHKCSWKLPEGTRQFITLSTNTELKMLFRSSFKGNLTVCKSNTTLRLPVTFFNQPKCCPYCPWYEEDQCIYEENNELCTVIIVFQFFKTRNLVQLTIYNNNTILISCPARPVKYNTSLIIKDSSKDLVDYSDGKIMFIRSNYFYNPYVGLYVNSIHLNGLSLIYCSYHYLDRLELESNFIIVKKSHSSLNGNFVLQPRLVLSDEVKSIDYLQNISFVIKCHQTQRYEKVLTCIKFYIKGQSKKFTCSELNVAEELLINPSDITNGSQVICTLLSPDRAVQRTIKLTLYEHRTASLKLLSHFSNDDSKTILVLKNKSQYKIDIKFYSVPTFNSTFCKPVLSTNFPYNVSCQIKSVGLCRCMVLRFNKTFSKIPSTFQIRLTNHIDTYIFNVTLKPQYLELPTITGLTSRLEDNKKVHCSLNASKPLTFSWQIKVDEEEYFHNDHDANFIIIPLRHHKTICASCTASNGAGTKTSEVKCQSLIDGYIAEGKFIQISFLNVSTWTNNNKIQRIERLEFKEEDTPVNVVANNNLTISCMSRYIHSRIDLLLLNSNISFNRLNLVTNYSRRLIISVNIDDLIMNNYSGIYSCRQQLLNGSFVTDSSSNVNILKGRPPHINVKYKVIVNRNAQFSLILNEFPASKIHVYQYSIEKRTKKEVLKKLSPKKFSINYYPKNTTFTVALLTIFSISHTDTNRYQVIAINEFGFDKCNLDITALLAAESISIMPFMIFAGALLFVILISVTVICTVRRKKDLLPVTQIINTLYKSLEMDVFNILPEIWPNPQERERWTINSKQQIKVLDKIGGGNYGNVYLGKIYINDSWETIALKEPVLTKPIVSKDKTDNARQFCQSSWDCFVNEVRVLSKLGDCANIIQMYGCTLQNVHDESTDSGGGDFERPITLLVLEYCDNRSLTEFIQQNSSRFSLYTKTRKVTSKNGYIDMKVDEGLTLLDLKQIALGIANGLEYLSRKEIIHRDIAMRNILLDSKRVTKITDFGLAVDLASQEDFASTYQIISINKKLPFKILAPEALKSRTFYVQSDIWSFSLLMWELFNLNPCSLFPKISRPIDLLNLICSCSQRFNEIEEEEEDEEEEQEQKDGVQQTVSNDFKNVMICDALLPKPKFADEPIWRIIQSCWVLNPLKRPTAAQIHNQLLAAVRNSPIEVIKVSGPDNEFATGVMSTNPHFSASVPYDATPSDIPATVSPTPHHILPNLYYPTSPNQIPNYDADRSSIASSKETSTRTSIITLNGSNIYSSPPQFSNNDFNNPLSFQMIGNTFY